jgi:biotin operon repressor
MRYQLALDIHDRIEEVLRLIKTGQYSTPALAAAVGVSIPTISRIVAILRKQGHSIHSVRTSKGWRYIFHPSDDAVVERLVSSENSGATA